MSYIKGVDRSQKIIFPPAIDDYIAEDNVARFIDAFVDGLDLDEAGFVRAEPKATGRPGYDPRDLLKLYIYGYINNIRSSRRLERETHRNLELIWLLRGLEPDFKTIADFRKDNRDAFKEVFRQFNAICDGLELFGKELVAIDGSKFKAVNSKDRNFTKARLEKKLRRLDEVLNAYLKNLDDADAKDQGRKKLKTRELQGKIGRLKKRKGRYRKLLKELEASGNSQISLTDPESRSMPKSPKIDVGYNVQVAVDSKHKLIVAQDITNDVNDLNQLSKVALEAKETLGVERFEVVADMGYYNGAEVKRCMDEGVVPYMNKPDTSANKKLGLFGKDSFRFNAKKDVYVCPAKQELKYHLSSVERGRHLRYYWTTACRGCALKPKCTRSVGFRRITRSSNDHLLEAMARRVAKDPQKLKRRKGLVEHPFGTIKHWRDQSAFLMIGLEKVRAEFSLTALTYNIKRVMNIVGVDTMMSAVA